MKRLVAAVQVFAVLCTLGFVVMLFANEPDAGGGAQAAPSNAPQTVKVSGAEVFGNRCAGCHGSSGGGGLGPQLSQGKVKAHFPDIADQIAVITDGRGGMPAFGGKLTDEQIRAVAEYERSL